jgi:hypothetical protein
VLWFTPFKSIQAISHVVLIMENDTCQNRHAFWCYTFKFISHIGLAFTSTICSILSLSLSLSRYIYIVVPKCGTGLQQDFLTLCAVVLLDQLSLLDVEHQAHCCTNLQTSNQGLWFCNQQMGSSQA